MKRSFGLLAASALLVLSLAACGGEDRNDGAEGDTTPPMTDNAVDNGVISDTPDNPVDDNGTSDNRDDEMHNTDDADSDDVITGTDDADREDTVEKQSSRIGASYSQMLRNAHVHDTDGDLTDYENTVTPGAAHLY